MLCFVNSHKQPTDWVMCILPFNTNSNKYKHKTANTKQNKSSWSNHII